MPLNIKDEDVHAKARQLAVLTGVSITAAVRDAVSQQLNQITRERLQAVPAKSPDKLMELARVCAEAINGAGLTSDHSDLYDDRGMPL
jgi:antitoxin VapB